MCRGRSMNFSRNSAPSPNAASASERALSNASSSSFIDRNKTRFRKQAHVKIHMHVMFYNRCSVWQLLPPHNALNYLHTVIAQSEQTAEICSSSKRTKYKPNTNQSCYSWNLNDHWPVQQIVQLFTFNQWQIQGERASGSGHPLLASEFFQ